MSLLRSMTVGVVLSVLGVGSVQAVPVNYVESGSEFNETFNSFDGVNRNFTLDIGLNSISGTDQFEDLEGDAFGFVVQNDHQLVSATFSVLTFAGYEGNSASASIGSDPDIWSGDLGSSLSVGEGESGSFSVYSWNYLNLPLDAGDYIAICCGGGYRGTSHGYALPVFTYRYDFMVAAAPPPPPPVGVPEPASLALMGLGLIGLGFSRRKKAA